MVVLKNKITVRWCHRLMSPVDVTLHQIEVDLNSKYDGGGGNDTNNQTMITISQT